MDLAVLGQFNSGFIITFLRASDELFIIDQHASDEKINFEKLLREEKFQSQLLFCPITLSFTELEVQMIEQNQEIFEKNGFRFDTQENAVILKKIPISYNMQFDQRDFLEIFYNL